jgi:hypothetical protein
LQPTRTQLKQAKKTGINRKTIQMVAKHYCYTNSKGKVIRYLTAGGYKWEYIKKGK